MRMAVIAIGCLASACLYDQDVDGDFVSCAAHSDCEAAQRCGGVLSTEETCLVDGYIGLDDDGVFPERPEDQDSVFFQCDQGRRYYSYCTGEKESVCDGAVGGQSHLCGKPLDGSDTRTYPVALRLGTDALWQCNQDLTCSDSSTRCLRMFEYDTNGYKVNRRVCVPTGLINQPPPTFR